MDVVLVELDKWIVDPWAGHITPEGRIYGRGTQVYFKAWDLRSLEIYQLMRFYKITRNFHIGDIFHLTDAPPTWGTFPIPHVG